MYRGERLTVGGPPHAGRSIELKAVRMAHMQQTGRMPRVVQAADRAG